MTIVFTAPAHGDAGFAERCKCSGIVPVLVEHARYFEHYSHADLFIDAAFDGFFAHVNAPLLFHAPALVFDDLHDAPVNSARFCAWPGFWERSLWELATLHAQKFSGESVLNDLGITTAYVKDIPGLIGPRILCTLINEAAYAVEDGIASAGDVDIAMKLGTNYPKGPAEWAAAIGCADVLSVLNAMGQANQRYFPHPKLCKLFF